MSICCSILSCTILAPLGKPPSKAQEGAVKPTASCSSLVLLDVEFSLLQKGETSH